MPSYTSSLGRITSLKSWPEENWLPLYNVHTNKKAIYQTYKLLISQIIGKPIKHQRLKMFINASMS